MLAEGICVAGKEKNSIDAEKDPSPLRTKA